MFVKGESGNPSGRKKKTPELRRIEEMAKLHTEDALAALVNEARRGKGAPRVAAAIALLDRAWGRPVDRSEQGKPGEFAGTRDELVAGIKERGLKLGVVMPLKRVS